MNDRPDLAGLRDGLDLPPTRVAEGAWELGRRRVRRRRAAGAAAVVALVAAILVPTLTDGGGLRGVEPATPTPSRTGDPGGLAPIALDDAAYTALLDEAVVPPTTPVATLADDPLEKAAAVVEQNGDALVLGADGTYRRIEVGLDGRGPVRASSLDPTASRVALMGDGRLVVADLPASTTTSIALPARLGRDDPDVLTLAWRDETHVVVYGTRTSALVDVEQGTTEPFDLRGPATFGEGGPASWASSKLFVDGEARTTRVQAIGFGPGPTPPLLGDGYLVATAVATRATLRDEPEQVEAGAPVSVRTGVAVLDLDTSDLRAFLPVDAITTGSVDQTVPLALEGDAVVLGVATPGDVGGDHTLVLRWDPSGATLDAVTVLPSESVAWGQGWQPPGDGG